MVKERDPIAVWGLAISVVALILAVPAAAVSAFQVAGWDNPSASASKQKSKDVAIEAFSAWSPDELERLIPRVAPGSAAEQYLSARFETQSAASLWMQLPEYTHALEEKESETIVCFDEVGEPESESTCFTLTDFSFDSNFAVTDFVVDGEPVSNLVLAPQGQSNWPDLSASIIAGTLPGEAGSTMHVALRISNELSESQTVDVSRIIYRDEAGADSRTWCAFPSTIAQLQRTRVWCATNAEPGGWFVIPTQRASASEPTWHWIPVER